MAGMGDIRYCKEVARLRALDASRNGYGADVQQSIKVDAFENCQRWQSETAVVGIK
jgi:hypothetical protein